VAAIAVAVASLVRTGSASFAQDVLSQRAFLAAESGAGLGLNRVFAPSGAGACSAWTFDLDLAGLDGCSAIVSCTAIVVAGETQYAIESAGRCATAAEAAERHVTVRAAP
jgi:MSHA biogenesis protein MshP